MAYNAEVANPALAMYPEPLDRALRNPADTAVIVPDST
jgi:hypothetical protein